MGGKHTLQGWGVFQRGVTTLNAPAIGVVEGRIGDQRAPGRKDLLLLGGRRQNPGRVAAAAKGLVDRYNLALRDAPGLGCLDGSVDDAVVGAVELGLHRVGVDAVEVDAGVGRVIGIGKGRIGVGAHVHEHDEGLGARVIGVNPIGLGLEVGGCHQGAVLAGGIGLVSEVKAIDLGVADERLDGAGEGGSDAVAHAEPHEGLVAGRQGVDITQAADIGQVEAGLGRNVLAVHEVVVGRVVQAGDRPVHGLGGRGGGVGHIGERRGSRGIDSGYLVVILAVGR